jgi:hypothetical protein
MQFLGFYQFIKKSSLSSPAHGMVVAMATSFLVAHFAKRNTKFGDKKRGWAKIPSAEASA